MFTGIITDIGRIEAVEARGDLRVRIACGYDMAARRSRRVDRLLGRLPDRRRQGRGLVRGRRLGRDAEPHRAGPVGRGRRAQPRARAQGSATSSAAISSPAMSTASARSIAAEPVGDSLRLGIDRRRRARALYRRQGLDRARRRLADRQRGRAAAGGGVALRRQHHPPHRRPDQLRRGRRRAAASTSRSTSSPAISAGCWRLAPALSVIRRLPHHIMM